MELICSLIKKKYKTKYEVVFWKKVDLHLISKNV